MDEETFERMLAHMPMAMEKMDELRDSILLNMVENPLTVARDMTVIMMVSEIMVGSDALMKTIPEHIQKWLKELYGRYGIVI